MFVGIFFRRLLIGRKESAAFQINEICRHHDKFPSDVDVQFLESLKIFEVLAGNTFERNVDNIDLIAFDQVKEQIEWTFEDLELDLLMALPCPPRPFSV